jgi:uncharacterized protein (TIGR04562 family)
MSFGPLNFDIYALESMIGGVSVLDIPYFSIQSRTQAADFLKTYGYDVTNADDLQKMWSYHRKAVTYIQNELLRQGEIIPAKLSDPNELGDITNLFIMASTRDNELQRWAGGILKVIHIFVHLENDLFAQFSSEIQDQILKPIQAHIYEDSVIGTTLGPALGPKSIVLKKVDIKSFKTSISSVTKLLAKRELVAFNLLDKVGVRIVTKHLFDVFRVLKYFLENNIVSFPHNIPEQSNNTLYPLNLFLETLESLSRDREYASEEIDQMLVKRLEQNGGRAVFLEKQNTFSSQDYRFMKFITRRLIRITIKINDRPQTLSFFYPYEIQIVDYDTHTKNMGGPASHERYKERQIRRARARILGHFDRLKKSDENTQR